MIWGKKCSTSLFTVITIFTTLIILYVFVNTFCGISMNIYSTATQYQLKTNNSVIQCRLIQKPSNKFTRQNDDPFIDGIKELESDAIRSNTIVAQQIPCLQTISKVCSRYNLSTVPAKRHYLYSPKNTSLYCWIRKVASTSFTKLFSDLRNRKVFEDYYKEIDILSPQTTEELVSLTNDSNVLKFLFVRHPFERIVSTYRDRLEDNKKYTAQAWIYVPRIFHLTRPNLFHTNETTGSSLDRIFDKNKRLKLVPTFKEFITWLLQEPTLNDDVHWDSYYSHCSVCNINYNYVMKLEDYAFEDLDFILSKMGLSKGKANMPRLEETSGGFTDYRRACRYFKALSLDMILKLYQRYKIDFEMFDYNYNVYLKCSKSESLQNE